MIDRFEKFSLAISDISRYWHKIASDEMIKQGRKGNNAIYLTALQRFPEGITSAKLSEICGKDKADVSRAMAVLEKKGLVEKRANNNNFYRALLKLTEKGEEATTEVSKKAETAVRMASEGVSEEDRKIFYNTLDVIASNLLKLSKGGL